MRAALPEFGPKQIEVTRNASSSFWTGRGSPCYACQWMRTLFGFALMTATFLAASLSIPAADHGRIYVYAQRLTAAHSWLPITCDETIVAELKQGRFLAIDMPSGRHSIGTEAGLPAFVDIRSGEEAFIRLDWHYEVGRSPIPVLGRVNAERARKEMKYLSYTDAPKALSMSVPKIDPREPVELQSKRRPAR